LKLKDSRPLNKDAKKKLKEDQYKTKPESKIRNLLTKS